jgi:hypothetical protein
VKFNANLDLSTIATVESLLKEYKDVFAWSMKSQRNTSPHCSTLDKIGYNNIAFSSKLVSNESQLWSCGEI